MKPTIFLLFISLITVGCTAHKYQAFYLSKNLDTFSPGKIIIHSKVILFDKENTYVVCSLSETLNDSIIHNIKSIAQGIYNISGDTLTLQDTFGKTETTIYLVKMDDNESLNLYRMPEYFYDAQGNLMDIQIKGVNNNLERLDKKRIRILSKKLKPD